MPAWARPSRAVPTTGVSESHAATGNRLPAESGRFRVRHCYLNSTGDHVHVYVADTSSFDGNIPAFVSGSETVHINASANPGLLCAAEGTFNFYTLPHASFTTIVDAPRSRHGRYRSERTRTATRSVFADGSAITPLAPRAERRVGAPRATSSV